MRPSNTNGCIAWSISPSSERAFCSGERSSKHGLAGAAFATLTHGGFLGALITLAPFPLYDWYVDRAEFWGVTALGDHQLAGRLVAPRTRRDVQVARMGSIFVAQVPLQVGSP
jgi:hypothetical protein